MYCVSLFLRIVHFLFPTAISYMGAVKKILYLIFFFLNLPEILGGIILSETLARFAFQTTQDSAWIIDLDSVTKAETHYDH